MKLFCVFQLATVALASVVDRQPLSYAPLPAGTYVTPANASATTLLEFIKSRSDLTTLASVIDQVAGFADAFATAPTWSFTFFAPSNAAFENTGSYYSTYVATPKGKWWLGNVLQHHYVPNSQIKTSAFNSTYTRLQTGSFLFVGTQIVGGNLVLNNVSTVVASDLPVTSGIVHVIDHILDPSAQIFQPDVARTTQTFIAGSCSNPDLPYC